MYSKIRSQALCDRYARLLVTIAIVWCGAHSVPLNAQEAERSAELRFQFSHAPWEDVVHWLAENSGLALQFGDLPTGSFTYTDSRAYTPDGALNRINLFLIPRGYSLVRSKDLLTVTNLNDEVSLRQLDTIAELIEPEQLEEEGDQMLVKCLFPLNGVEPEIALQELSNLQLVRSPVALAKSSQIVAVDTVVKLRTVKSVLNSLAVDARNSQSVMQFPLAGLNAEEVLAVLRPHLGMDPNATNGDDISLSVDQTGQQILASGSKQNLAKVADVFGTLRTASEVSAASLRFRTHLVGTANLEIVMRVLQTLLASEDVRLTSDKASNQIAVLGSERVHEIVVSTIADLSDANPVEFKAIPVRTVDPRYAAAMLRQMFMTPLVEGAPNTVDDTLKIDVDLLNSRLFVRARPSEIAQIELVLSEMTEPEVGEESALRLFPYRGERGRQILESARAFWPSPEELQVLPAVDESDPRPLEREINPEPREFRAPIQQPLLDLGPASGRNPSRIQFQRPRSESDRQPIADKSSSRERLVHARNESKNAADKTKIWAQWTPRGILVHSDDPQSMVRFEKHLEMIAGPAAGSSKRLAVLYLKHCTVSDANTLLRQVLDAEESAAFSGLPAPDSAGMGDLLGGLGIGSSAMNQIWSAGSVTIIPDKRLNRLFVYGTTTDITDIEQHLSVIDRENSIAQIKTHGTPHVIQLEHARAEQVLEILRDAYSGRIAASREERQQAAQQAAQKAAKKQAVGTNDEKEVARGTPMGFESGEQPKMTLAVDKPSNSVIVTAPEQLANEVAELARTIDQQSVQEIQVVRLPGMGSPKVMSVLKNVLGDQVRSSASTQPPSGSGRAAATARAKDRP